MQVNKLCVRVLVREEEVVLVTHGGWHQKRPQGAEDARPSSIRSAQRPVTWQIQTTQWDRLCTQRKYTLAPKSLHTQHHSHLYMFTLTNIYYSGRVTQQWHPFRVSTITTPHPHVAPQAHRRLLAVAPTVLVLHNLSGGPEMSHLSIGEAYCFRGLPLSCTGQSCSGGPPWGRQTSRGHLDYKRCIWLNERAGLSMSVSMSLTRRLLSPGVCFSTSLLKVLCWLYESLIHFFICLLLSKRSPVWLQLMFLFSVYSGQKVTVKPDHVLQVKLLHFNKHF